MGSRGASTGQVTDRRQLEAASVAAWNCNAIARAREITNSGDPAYQALQQVISRQLAESIGQTGRVLDAGCGVGVLTGALWKMSYDLLGIDPSELSIKQARTLAPAVTYEVASIEETARKTVGQFDAVIANMVLHTATDLQSFLEAARTCLQTGGVFIATIPHPCFYLQSRDGFEQADFDYNAESVHWLPFRIRNRPPHPAATLFIHRPLATYVNTMIRSGLQLDSHEEPPHVGTGRPHDVVVLRGRAI